MDEAILERLKLEHGDIYVLSTGDDEIVVKMPTPAQFERFGANASDDKKAVRAMTQFVKDCLVHPSKADVDALFARRPGLPLAFGKELVRISGATVEIEAKKA